MTQHTDLPAATGPFGSRGPDDSPEPPGPPRGPARTRPLLGGGIPPAWWVAAVACLTIVVAGAFGTVPGLLVDPLHGEFDWSRGTIGLAVSVNMVLNGLIAPFAASLMDRFGIRRVVAGALALLVAGATATTVMTAAWQFVLAWGVLVGLGAGSLAMTFAATLADRWFVRRRGLVTGLLTGASVFGQMVFLPALAWVVDRWSWRPAVVILALAALALLPSAWLLLRDHPADLRVPAYGATGPAPRPAPVPGAAHRAVRVLLRAARTGPFWLLAGTFAICGASTNGIMWTHFTPAAHDHGMPVTVAASLLAVIGVFSLAGTVGAGWLTDRADPRRILAAAYGLRAVSLLLLPLLMGPVPAPALVLFAVAFGLLDVATVPPTIALCRQVYGRDGAIVFGWVLAAHQAGAGVLAVAGGLVRDLSGSYDPVWVGSGALCAVAVPLVMMISRRAA
ncbi:MFS transporter [Streptomyces sp. ACA25]|uniref:MFS transporter n=1 Tax=Streptomyces sp. ACA25 TaxID=3022596 RepID=UPI0023077A8C|nr:MFS transporter [Streptomyces sp. ACA25]MDB1086358.1 MFS transporter [Streptomyces sp. ACA25]